MIIYKLIIYINIEHIDVCAIVFQLRSDTRGVVEYFFTWYRYISNL